MPTYLFKVKMVSDIVIEQNLPDDAAAEKWGDENVHEILETGTVQNVNISNSYLMYNKDDMDTAINRRIQEAAESSSDLGILEQ